ncbi:MAG TPA: hypothetical protein P5110_00025 [Candidatus Omnitrophota bacterium]|nr:hypothetical protein [Candidatus Omnitrophota bacterium]
MAIKALALISGGLDSILAARIVKDAGIETVGVYFRIPFSVRKRKGKTTHEEYARQLAATIGIELNVVDLDEEFFRLVEHPAHGFGKRMNPCIDCRLLMLKKAREMLAPLGAAFIVTGEVVGQRPMSQHKHTIVRIDEEAGLQGLILRPLSGKLLGPTVPEQQGWIAREQLFAFNGRERRPQIDLAIMRGITDFPYPAGGCLLTDIEFCRRLDDFMRHGKLSVPEIELLKLGRHFRLSGQARLVVGRDEEENLLIEKRALPGDYLFLPPDDIGGPTCLGRGAFDEQLLVLAARIACAFCSRKGRTSVVIRYSRLPEAQGTQLEVEPLTCAEIEKLKR